MEPTIYKPSIYKGAGIYKAGAEGGGGGGANVVNVDGIEYEFVRIGKYYFTTENLKNIFSGLTLNGSVTQPSYRWFGNNQETSLQNKYNIAYSVPCIDYINNYVPIGWRCADKTEWDYIGHNFGSVNKLLSWDNNELCLSLVKNGNGDNSGNWFNIGYAANMLSKITLCSFMTDSYQSSGSITNRFAAVRLVKDV